MFDMDYCYDKRNHFDMNVAAAVVVVDDDDVGGDD